MKTRILLLFICAMAINSGCIHSNVNPDDCQATIPSHVDYRVKIQNNSNKTITASVSTSFPDTAVSTDLGMMYIGDPTFKAVPGSNFTFISTECWEVIFDRVPSHKIQFFIYDVNIFNKYPWDTIAARNIFLKRYVFTEDSLRSLHWRVNFP